MFDLDKAIADWKKELLQSGLTLEECDELENHLRSRFEDSSHGEVLDRESFERALRALGATEHLADQFLRSKPPIRRMASLVMKSNPSVSILAAAIIVASTIAITNTQQPRYQMMASERTMLRLDTHTGDVCAVVIYTSGLEGDCVLADGTDLMVSLNLRENYRIDFSGNIVRRTMSETR